MKKHGVLFNMINNSIIFSPRYHTHPRASSFPIPTISTKKTKIRLIATHQNVFLIEFWKKFSVKNRWHLKDIRKNVKKEKMVDQHI